VPLCRHVARHRRFSPLRTASPPSPVPTATVPASRYSGALLPLLPHALMEINVQPPSPL